MAVLQAVQRLDAVAVAWEYQQVSVLRPCRGGGFSHTWG